MKKGPLKTPKRYFNAPKLGVSRFLHLQKYYNILCSSRTCSFARKLRGRVAISVLQESPKINSRVSGLSLTREIGERWKEIERSKIWGSQEEGPQSFYGLATLKELVLLVRKDAFLSSLAEDSDICSSFSLMALSMRLDLMSAVMPFRMR